MNGNHQTFRPLAVLAAVVLVHVAIATSAMPETAQAAAPASPAPHAQPLPSTNRWAAIEGLPPPVADMRDAILEAVRSGRLDDLKVALDLNELKPELAAIAIPDPIDYWRRLSPDGEGKGVLGVLGLLLEMPYAVQPLGKDPENSRLFVWPAFADRPIATLTADEHAHLEKLEPPDKISAMKTKGNYTGWRLVIGADGVWHVFRRYD